MEKPFPEQRHSLWRRKLSGTERAAMRNQPELELEARLTDALAQLPDVPVPSNFIARVLEATEREEARSARAVKLRFWPWNWPALMPRVAVVTTVLVLGGFGVQHYEAAQHRTELAKNLSLVASAQTMPSLDALENLEVIQRMSQPTHADTELIAVLQ
jgi:negative regulator of sigma E activity